MRLGDLYVHGTPPAKLVKALAVIAHTLHPEFDRVPRLAEGRSRMSCVLVSHAVRDFLWKIGFKEARLQTVYGAVRAYDAEGEEIHSLGVGDHTNVPTLDNKPVPDTATHWSGHMVVVVDGWLIDCTCYQMQRPAWPDLPGMVAIPVETEDDGTRVFGMRPLAGLDGGLEGRRMTLAYFEQENERWRVSSPDLERSRRAPVIKALVAKFNPWRDAA